MTVLSLMMGILLLVTDTIIINDGIMTGIIIISDGIMTGIIIISDGYY